MLFMVRSAACIGAVAFVASGGWGMTLGALTAGAGRQAVETAKQACLASEDCLRAGASLLAGRIGGEPGRDPIAALLAPTDDDDPRPAGAPSLARPDAGRHGPAASPGRSTIARDASGASQRRPISAGSPAARM